MRLLLYGLFFLSGLAGLVYETIWSRYLGLFVGHGSYAQVIVLVVFLGGLSLGSVLVGRISEDVRWPLLWYAAAEAAVGLVGLFFHDIYLVVTTAAREVLFPTLAGTAYLTPVKWLLASALILPPSMLLGTTFPFMSAGMIRAGPERPGRTLSLLYFTNSLGAAMGALVAGFFLVGYVGLPGTVLVAAVLNLTVAVAAWLAWGALRRRGRAGGPAPAPPTAGSADTVKVEPATADALWGLLLAVSFGTAAASFIYEISWIRMLSLVLGAATHSFELMLSAFILGLALGAFWMRRRADELEDPVAALGWIQWIMGAAALATLPLYVASFHWTADLLATLQENEAGYRAFNLARYGTALAVMLPSTFCAGTTLPLITRTLLSGSRGEGAIGWVYGVNTLGSIVGVTVASLLLMPVLGLKNLLALGAGLDMLLGVALLARSGRGVRIVEALTGRAGWALAGGTALLVVVGAGVHLDRELLNSGVYRHGTLRENEREVVYYRDGRTASVAVERNEAGLLSLFTNGKADASIGRRWLRWSESLLRRGEGEPLPDPPDGVRRPLEYDEPTQSLLALITLAHRADARSAAVVGQGSGLTSHFLLGSPRMEEVVTVEIEPAMVEGSRVLYPGNRRVFDDPRSRIVLDDAKSYFASSQRSFDVVVSEPSNPWVSGVASLFTVEFYRTVRRHLSSGGVFGQWIHLYELNDELLLTVLAAIHRVFPAYQVFQVQEMDFLVVASADGAMPRPDWSVFREPPIRADFGLTHPFGPGLLEATRVLTRPAMAPLLDGWGHPNSDFYPILDLGAERARYLGGVADGFLATAQPGFDPSDTFLPPRTELLSADSVPTPQISPVRALERTTRLRRALAPGGPPTDEAASGAPPDSRLAGDLYRVRSFRAVLADEGPPASWHRWTREAEEVVGLLHAGAEGAVYEPIFRRLEAYVVERDGPEGARAAVAFLEGLHRRDWEGVASAASTLHDGLRRGRAWLPVHLLADAGVPALVATGHSGRARALLRDAAPRLERRSSDVRSRLLRAYVERGSIDPGPSPESSAGG